MIRPNEINAISGRILKVKIKEEMMAEKGVTESGVHGL